MKMKKENTVIFAHHLAIISDIHGNRRALEAVLNDIERRGIDHMVNLGDSLYGPLDPAGTAEILIKLNIPTVRGNEDRIITGPSNECDDSPSLRYVKERLNPEHLQWLESLKMTAVAHEIFFLCHGSPERDDEYLLQEVLETGVFPKKPKELAARLAAHPQQVFLCGHDHVPGTVHLPDGRIIVNPGSVGLPAYTDDFPFPHAMETFTPHARYSIIYKEANGFQVENIAVPYDWRWAEGMAKKNGRSDWAEWLGKGRT
ncbi:MAG: metallophosphoesterase family protein [bacterium]|nr:metallophosphoesterase family protein [bacterium]